MKKSTHVRLGLLASFAMVLSSCRNNKEMQRCVNDDYMVVEDQRCLEGNAVGTPTPGNGSSGGGYYGYGRPGYHWYYGGAGSYTPGTRAFSGSDTPHSGLSGVLSNGSASHSSSSSGSVTRGGFGSAGSAAGHS